MSQSSLLEDVFYWDETECRHRCREAIPKLAACYEDGDCLQEKLKYLQILCQSFVPVAYIDQLEDLIFAKISARTIEYFNSTLERIGALLIDCNTDLHIVIQARLNHCGDILDCIVTGMEGLMQRNDVTELRDIHSLQYLTLQLTKTSYSHCQDSASIYGELMASVSEQLSSLFKKAHTLQTTFLSLMERISMSSPSQSDVDDMCSILEGLFHISQIASNLDVKIMATLLKTISRIACQYKDDVKQQLDVAMMIRALCSDVESSLEYNLLQLATQLDNRGQVIFSGDEKAYMKGMKILGFQMKVLVMLVKEYDGYLGDCYQQLYHLILTMIRWLPPSLHTPNIPDPLKCETEKQALIAVEPLLVHLVANRDFATAVLKNGQDFQKELYFPYCMLLTRLSNIVPKQDDIVQDMWLSENIDPYGTPTITLIEAMFLAYDLCEPEERMMLKVDGVMCNGKPQKKVNLGEHVLTQICGLVASLPSRHFTQFEMCLFSNVLSRNVRTALLAIDTWCFVVRYGTSELCRDHCQQIAGLVNTLQPNSCVEYNHLVFLLRRLVRFMAVEHQEEFIKVFPPENNINLWCVMEVSTFSTGLLSELIETIVTTANKKVHSWNENADKTLESLNDLIIALTSLQNIYSQGGQSCLEASVQVLIAGTISQCWSCLPTKITRPCGLHTKAWCILVALTSHLIGADRLTNAQLLQMLETISLILDQPTDYFKLSVNSMLLSMATMTLSESVEQQKIIHELPELFSILISDPNFIIQSGALIAFTKFGEESPYESILPDTLNIVPDYRDFVVQFVNKIPIDLADSVDKLETTKKQCKTIREYLNQPIEQLCMAESLHAENEVEESPHPDEAEGTEPCPKRLKEDLEIHSEDNERLTECLSKINNGLLIFEEVQEKISKLPHTYKSQLLNIQQRLCTLLEKY
ncbi:unnamed protein product [Owenia fusiformis]|uniref:Uncharacterized protein n=1 Tax=Owenia fusiformis TaxID=6347 RepID=A0A8J1UE44_OWEFU|nr:unnamed protein product [Owenia fusiformis]